MPAPREEVCARASPRGTARRFEPSPTPLPHAAHDIWFDAFALTRVELHASGSVLGGQMLMCKA